MNDLDDAAEQWAEAGRWLAKADEDIAVAEMALSREPPLVDPAPFTASRPRRKSSTRCLLRQRRLLREVMTWNGWSGGRRRFIRTCATRCRCFLASRNG
jgi:hypothetical protein